MILIDYLWNMNFFDDFLDNDSIDWDMFHYFNWIWLKYMENEVDGLIELQRNSLYLINNNVWLQL